MTLRKIIDILEARTISLAEDLDTEINSACSTDLMSDVLYYHSGNSMLITGIIQPHVIRTAEVTGIRTIVFVFNKQPEASTIELAEKKQITLLSTKLCTYNASGKLYSIGLSGCKY